MGYRRWKPNAAQKAAYIEKLKERESVSPRGTSYAIRVGCNLEFYSMNKGEVIKGEVVNESYGEKTNQHTFTIRTTNGKIILVKGRNLYPNVINHNQGITSQLESK